MPAWAGAWCHYINNMGYVIVILGLIVLIPFVLFLLNRRVTSREGDRGRQGNSVTAAEPAADEPTPGEGNVNPGTPSAARRVPPA